MIRKFIETYSSVETWMGRLLVLCLLFCPLTMIAQRVKKVCGEYTYYAEGNESINEAKMKALEAAKMKAIADEFGTVITQSTSQSESLDDGREHTFFSQLNSSEVKGEWLEDLGKPKYEISYTDDMFLYFQAPSNGYVAVYLVDEAPNAYCLLPYSGDTDGQQIIKGGKEYIFFSISKAVVEKELVDEYTLTCADIIERNKIYVIFSKKPFTKAVDHKVSDALPKQLGYAEFSHWLGRQRAHDPEMGVKVMHIEIKK